MIYHINKSKYENHMILSVDDYVKKSEKFKNEFMIKNITRVAIEGTHLNKTKFIDNKLTANIKFNGEKLSL